MVAMLKNMPLLSALTTAEAKALVESSSKETHHKGAMLIKEGDSGDFMMIIIEGDVNSLSEH